MTISEIEKRGKAIEKAGPQTAFHKIRGLEVTGGFLDGMRLEFGEGLNCLIGGRGTGKTTVLELIRWTLDQMPDDAEDSDRFRVIDRLVQANLGAGQVKVEIETMNGSRYIVRRTYGEAPLVLGINEEPIGIDIGRGRIFSLEVYSQNQVEEIANDPLFQLKLIDKFVTEQIRGINDQVQTCVRELEANAVDIVKCRSEIAELKDQIAELPEVTEKLKAFKSEAAGEEAKILQKESGFKAIRDQEYRCLEALQQALSNTEDGLRNTVSDLPRQITECCSDDILHGPNGALFQEIKTIVESGVRDLIGRVNDAIRVSEATRNKLQVKAADVETVHLRQEKAYQDLLEKSEQEQDQAKERDGLLRRLAKLQEGQKRLEKRREELLKKENDRKTLLRRLSDLKDERFRLRSDVAKALTTQLAPTIRVQIEQYGNVDGYRDLVMESMKGSGFKYTQVVDRLVQRIPPHEFAAIVQRADVQSLKDHLEIDADRANRMILQLKDSKAVFDIEVVELYDRPTIELQDGQDYKDSSALSTGQKCTTILPILLLESASPLLIDQPEDNLDNAFIYETVVKSVRGVRGKRQLVFITHNPNIPVLGEAQQVFVLQSNGRQANVKAMGTVDMVKDEIETILEGGKEAFQRRKERYGY